MNKEVVTKVPVIRSVKKGKGWRRGNRTRCEKSVVQEEMMMWIKVECIDNNLG